MKKIIKIAKIILEIDLNVARAEIDVKSENERIKRRMFIILIKIICQIKEISLITPLFLYLIRKCGLKITSF